MNEDSHLDSYYEAQNELPEQPEQWWEDDFHQMNMNEADDYRAEADLCSEEDYLPE